MPSAKSVQDDTKSIEKSLNGAGKALDQVSMSTQDIIKGMESHAKDVSQSLAEMTDLLNNLRENDEKKG